MYHLPANIEKVDFKQRLLKQCIQIIEQRIAAALIVIENAQIAANSEEKSSAGDKYETSRAMSHLEIAMHSRQLSSNRLELASLLNVDCNKIYDTTTTGSIVFCKGGVFFIAAGLGKLPFEGLDLYLLSPLAPLASVLFDKKVGGIFTFNKTELSIIDTF